MESGYRIILDSNTMNCVTVMIRVEIEFFRRIPLYSLPYEWNNVGDLIFHHNKNLFRNLLREKLLNEL
jgi:hypothetical protein